MADALHGKTALAGAGAASAAGEPVREAGAVALPAACTRRTVRVSFPTALASSPESVG